VQESEEPSPDSGPSFERMVDRALDLPRFAAATRASDVCPSRELLRAQALDARERLAAVAADEYDRYLALRAAAVARCRRPSRGNRRSEGLLPVAVLVPSLGAVATGVFLLCGFGLRAFAVRPHIGDGLVMAGVIAAAVTAGAALGDLAWLLATRSRSRSGRGGDDPADRDSEVRRAREEWERVVLERGLVPFLLERIASGRPDGERVHRGRVVGAEEATP
jgi:hypothetical protein